MDSEANLSPVNSTLPPTRLMWNACDFVAIVSYGRTGRWRPDQLPTAGSGMTSRQS